MDWLRINSPFFHFNIIYNGVVSSLFTIILRGILNLASKINLFPWNLRNAENWGFQEKNGLILEYFIIYFGQ